MIEWIDSARSTRHGAFGGLAKPQNLSHPSRKCPSGEIPPAHTMRLTSSPLGYLPAWADLNGIQFNGVAVSTMPNGKGTGLIATTEISKSDVVLVTVPQALILSLENVWLFAKSDQHLREVLEAVGEYSRVACPSTALGALECPI